MNNTVNMAGVIITPPHSLWGVCEDNPEGVLRKVSARWVLSSSASVYISATRRCFIRRSIASDMFTRTIRPHVHVPPGSFAGTGHGRVQSAASMLRLSARPESNVYDR